MQPTLTLPGGAFRATVELAGRTATGIRVPAAVVEALEAGRQPLVKVTIGEHTYRSKVAVRRGEYRLPINTENRELAGVQAGDEIYVAIDLDRDPRVVAVPSDLAAALEAAPDALHYFESLSYSLQQWYVLNVEDAKTPETRARRIENAVTRLREG
jgi:hypothetical protein